MGKSNSTNMSDIFYDYGYKLIIQHVGYGEQKNTTTCWLGYYMFLTLLPVLFSSETSIMVFYYGRSRLA